MHDDITPDGLPRWVPLAAVLALLILVGSGVGIRLLSQSLAAGAAPLTPDVPTGTPDLAPTITPTALSDAPSPTPSTTVISVYDMFRAGAMTHTTPLTLQAGKLVVIEGGRTPGSAALPMLRLFHPDGTLLVWEQLGYTRVRIPTTGTYSAEVTTPSDFNWGGYTLTARLAAPGEVPPWQVTDDAAWASLTNKGMLRPGDRGSGSLAAGEAHMWRILVDGGTPEQVIVDDSVWVAFKLPENVGLRRVAGTPTPDGKQAYTLFPQSDGLAHLHIIPKAENATYTLTTEVLTEGPALTLQAPVWGATSGAIGPGERHEWLFSGRVGQQMLLHVWLEELANSPPYGQPPLHVELLAPDGTTVEADASSNDVRAYTLPQGGIYTIALEKRKRAQGSVGYNLSLLMADGDLVTSHPAPLAPGDNLRAVLPPEGTEHTYTLELNAGQRVAVTAETSTERLFLTLYGPNEGGLVARTATDADPVEDTARLVYEAPTSGTYTLTASTDTNRVWVTYTLTAEEAAPFEPQFLTAEAFTAVTSRIITPGESVFSAIDRADQSHDYTIPAGTETVTIEVTGSGGMVPCLFTDTIVQACGSPSTISLNAGAASKVLRVVPLYGQTGDYALRAFEGAPPLRIPEGATPLTLGEETPANPAGYTFEGVVGRSYAIIVRPEATRLASSYTDPPRFAFNVTSQTGREAGFDALGDGTPLNTFLLLEGGPHYVEVTPPEFFSRGYTVELRDVTERTTEREGVLTPGTFTTGRLDHGGDSELWGLELTPGQLYTLRLSTPLPTPLRMLVSGIGEPVESDSGVLRFIATSEVAALAIFHPQQGALPRIPYTLTFDEGPGFTLTETRTLNEGEPQQGRLTRPGEAGRWLITLDTAEQAFITLPGQGFEVLVTDVSGELVTVQAEPRPTQTVFRFRAQAGQAGLYAVYVYRPDGGVGFYTITADVLD